MDAVISGRVGKALLLEGDSLQSFDVDDPGTLLPMRPSDYQLLFGDAPDVQFLEDTDAGSVARALEFEHNCACALDVALISLDPELSTELRTEAVDALEELLRDGQILARLENVLYAEPLPPSADIRGAIECCDANHATAVRTMFELLEHHQQAIREVKLTWDMIPLRTFEDEENRKQFKHLVIHEGLFHSLALARGSQPRIDRFRLNSMLNPSIQRMRHSREVLQQWVAPFLVKNNVPGLTPEIEGEEEQRSYSEKTQSRGRRSRNRARLLENVERQKELIVKAMKRRDFVRAREVIDELVEYHMEYDGPKYAVKSLCDLAMVAKTFGNHPLQLELTERCIDLQPDDGWSWAQHADALLQMQRPTEAWEAYKQAEAFGTNIVAKKGQAEVLKALGWLTEALDVYEEVIAEHPEDAVAKSGRAEVLKALGRLDEALAAYDEAIVDHPESVVAKNGRAEVLKALGRHKEALAAYDATIAEYPENIVARRGRAEVLKSWGRLEDALVAYDAINILAPQDAFTRNGRSSVLLALKRFDEALESLPERNLATIGDWIGLHIRGMVLLRMGRLDDAVEVFERGVRENPWVLDREVFRAGLALVRLKRRNFMEAKRVLDEASPSLLQPQVNVLRLHSCGELGEDECAIAAYGNLSAEPWLIPGDLIEELHRRYILKEGARHDDDWVIEKEADTLLLLANQYAINSQAYQY